MHICPFLDGGLLVIGQEVTSSGSVVPGRGLIGDLSRFNFWLASLSPYNIQRMAKKCGGEMGDLVAWSEVKYYIADDVSYKPETTCIKPGLVLGSIEVISFCPLKTLFGKMSSCLKRLFRCFTSATCRT